MDCLEDDASLTGSSHDFGKDILPKLSEKGRLYAYDFGRNIIPGEPLGANHYWKDVGTLDSYYEANMDLRSIRPAFNLYNREWPMRTAPLNSAPAKFVHLGPHRTGHAINSVVCEGTIVSGAMIKDSIISPNVRINSFSQVDGCIIMEGVEIGRSCKLKNCIIDKHVRLPENTEIGYDADEDAKRWHRTESGIVVLEKARRFMA